MEREQEARYEYETAHHAEQLQGAQPPPFLTAPSGSHYTRPRLGGLGGIGHAGAV